MNLTAKEYVNNSNYSHTDEIIFSFKNKTIASPKIIERNSSEYFFNVLNKEGMNLIQESVQAASINGQNFSTTTSIRGLVTSTTFEKLTKNYDQSEQYVDEIEFYICNSVELDLASCGFNFESLEFQIIFTSCNTPTIEDISPQKITFESVIKIKGKYFSKNSCENEVYIDGTFCRLISSTSTSITCKIGLKSGLIPNKFYQIEVLVKNIGYALHNGLNQITFLPVILSIKPKKGKKTLN